MKNYQFLIFSIALHVSNCENYVEYTEVGIRYKFHTEQLSWNEARLKCREENATLAIPRNQKEYDTIQKVFNLHPKSTIPGNYSDVIHLGFHDMFNEGEYLTETGQTLQYTYRKWHRNQPDGNSKENCGALVRNSGLADLPCLSQATFICQKINRLPKDTKIYDCPTSDNAYEKAPSLDSCYKLHVDPRPWAEARAVCRAEGGYLAIINTEDEEKYLTSLISLPENNIHHVVHKCCVYLGFHDIFQEGHFVTIFGDKLSDVGPVNWSAGNPSNSYGNENCGSLNKAGGLNDYPCASPAPFLCEMDVTDSPSIDIRFSDDRK